MQSTYGLNGAVSQKMATFINTAVRISNPRNCSTLKMEAACSRVTLEHHMQEDCDVYTGLYKKKLHGLSPRANYTDRATAACRRSDANFCG
jgi:hypothetical protein